MKEQKVIITDSDRDINNYIDMGWTVFSVTAQHVACDNGASTHVDTKMYGKFCFVLERDK